MSIQAFLEAVSRLKKQTDRHPTHPRQVASSLLLLLPFCAQIVLKRRENREEEEEQETDSLWGRLNNKQTDWLTSLFMSKLWTRGHVLFLSPSSCIPARYFEGVDWRNNGRYCTLNRDTWGHLIFVSRSWHETKREWLFERTSSGVHITMYLLQTKVRDWNMLELE